MRHDRRIPTSRPDLAPGGGTDRALRRARRRLRRVAALAATDARVAGFVAERSAFAGTARLLTEAERLAWAVGLAEDLAARGRAPGEDWDAALGRASAALVVAAKAKAAALAAAPDLAPGFDAEEFRLLRAHWRREENGTGVLFARLGLCLPPDAEEEKVLLRFLSKSTCAQAPDG